MSDTTNDLAAIVEHCKTGLLVAGTWEVDLAGDDLKIDDRLRAVRAVTSLWSSDKTEEHVIYESFPTREGVRQAIDAMHRERGCCGGACTSALADIDRHVWDLIGAFHHVDL